MDNQNPKELTLILQPELAEKIYHAILSLSEKASQEDIDYPDSTNKIEVLIEEKMKQYGINLEKVVSEKVAKIRESIQAIALKNLSKSLEELEKIYKKESDNHSITLSLLSRYNRIQNNLNKGIIEFDYADRKISQIFSSVIDMLKNLQEEDLQ